MFQAQHRGRLCLSQRRTSQKNAASISVLGDLTLLPPVFTPQGDGVNDKLNIEFTLFRVLDNTVVERDYYGNDLLSIKIYIPFVLQREREWDLYVCR